MKMFVFVPLFAVVGSVFFSTAVQAAEVNSILVRAKAGPVFYSNVDPISSAFGFGLNLGYRANSGFGLSGISFASLSASAQTSTNNDGSYVTSFAKSLFVGVAPSYSVSKSFVTLSFGLGVGVLSLTQYQYVSSSTAAYTTPEQTRSRLALAPGFEMDFEITAGLFANLGVQYVAGLGESPCPSYVLPAAGFGYRF